MRYWHDFLDSLDSDGGHIFILGMIIIAGMAAIHFQIMKADTIVDGAFGALLLALKDAGSNKDHRDTDGLMLDSPRSTRSDRTKREAGSVQSHT